MGTRPIEQSFQAVQRPPEFWPSVDNRSPAERRAERINQMANIMAERFAAQVVNREEPFWEKVKFFVVVILISAVIAIPLGIAAYYITDFVLRIPLNILQNIH